MGAVKRAFEAIGNGIVHVAEGIGNAVKGSVEQSISGTGELAGGVVSAAIDVTPIGAAAHQLTGGDGVDKFVDGVVSNIPGTPNGGVEGVRRTCVAMFGALSERRFDAATT